MRLFLLSLLLIFLAACGSPTVQPTATTKQAPGAAEGVAILFQRSGGLAGTTEQWAIYPDGRVVTGQGEERSVPASEVATLLRHIREEGFYDLEESYGMLSGCRDCFTYLVTVSDSGQLKSVTAVAEAADMPPQLLEIVNAINALVSRVFAP